ncbi:MAG: XdhC family protein [Desulfotomaculum sp.]|nr:XdhC family protein [Desulfotomaculum sp.]
MLLTCVIVECYHPVSRLLVLGGGHIAQPLVQIASLLQYEITVIDDRLEFATRERFPQAHNVICKNFQDALQKQKIDKGTSVVIITRGH